MLCYRGVQYLPTAHLYETIPGEVIGKYRGAEVRLRYLKSTVSQPSFNLIYRGAPYATGDLRYAMLAQA